MLIGYINTIYNVPSTTTFIINRVLILAVRGTKKKGNRIWMEIGRILLLIAWNYFHTGPFNGESKTVVKGSLEDGVLRKQLMWRDKQGYKD